MLMLISAPPREEGEKREPTAPGEASTGTRHGPLSQETKARILALAQLGTPEAEIAQAVGRSKEAVLRLVHGPKLKPHQWTSGSKGLRNSTAPLAAPEPPGPVSEPDRTKAPEVLAHQFWIRPGLMVELTMPADLSPQEARRVAQLIRVLPFQS